MSQLPDLSRSLLERVFPRTLIALGAAERSWLAREISATTELARVPECLAKRKWAAARGFAPDLARLEYFLRLAALAPETERRGFEHVAMATEPEWYRARFRFDPAHCLLESDWPLDSAHASPAEAHERRPTSLLIYREDGRPRFRALDEDEAALLVPLGLGVPLGRVLDRRLAPDFGAHVLHRWIDTGLLRAIDWAGV